jgi:hypothetical protein
VQRRPDAAQGADRLSAYVILPLHFTPNRIRTDPAGVIVTIRQTIEQGLRRPPLSIRALPPSA